MGSGDRLPTAKQMAAMAGAISGAKVSSGQCLRGFGVEVGARTLMPDGAERAHLAKLRGWRCRRAMCSWLAGPDDGWRLGR